MRPVFNYEGNYMGIIDYSAERLMVEVLDNHVKEWEEEKKNIECYKRINYDGELKNKSINRIKNLEELMGKIVDGLANCSYVRIIDAGSPQKGKKGSNFIEYIEKRIEELEKIRPNSEEIMRLRDLILKYNTNSSYI